MGGRTFKLLLTICLSIPSLAWAGAEPAGVDGLLERADAARSADPKAFERLLGELNGDERIRSVGQREQLQYLNAFAQCFGAHYVECISTAQKLLDSTKDIDTKVRAGALIVNARAVTHDFTAGLRQLEQSLSQFDRIRKPEIREHILGIAAVMHNQMGQYRLAEQYAARVLGMTQSERSKCFAGQSRVEARQQLGELTDDVATAVIGLCTSLKENVVANLARANLARKWAAAGQRTEALAMLRTHIAEIRDSHYPILIGEAESLLAELELGEGRAEIAEDHAKSAIAQMPDLQFTQAMVSSYRTLYQIAENRGDRVAALANYKRYAEADKAYLNEIKARETAYQIVRQETQQKSQQIELLARKNQVLQLQQKIDKQKSQASSLLIALLLLLVGSVGYWAYKIKRMQRSLRRMAEVDALTTVYSRHHFNRQSEESLQQAARAGEDVALIMFDLDHFKSINDRFGHVTGDWVLRQVSEACKGFCRRIDHIGRLGGEEFAILLPGCDLRAATRLAEDCRVRIASTDSEPSGHKFLVTASFGVTATVLSGYDLAKLLSHADMMLYRAKREGRNRVCMFDGEMLVWSQAPGATENERIVSHAVA